MEIITSKQNQTIKLAHKLANLSKIRRKEDLTVFDGISFAKDFAKNNQIKRLIVSQEIFEKEKDFVLKNDYMVVSNELIKYISPVKTSSGMITIVRIPKQKSEIDFSKKMILLEEIQDGGNLGSIIRSCLAFGIEQIVLSEKSADPYSPETIRASAGSIFNIDVFRNTNLVDFIKKNPAEYVITTPHTEIELNKSKIKTPVFIFGNEGRGVSQEISNLVENRIKIEQSDKIESLNLAASVSICLYQTRK